MTSTDLPSPFTLVADILRRPREGAGTPAVVATRIVGALTEAGWMRSAVKPYTDAVEPMLVMTTEQLRREIRACWVDAVVAGDADEKESPALVAKHLESVWAMLPASGDAQLCGILAGVLTTSREAMVGGTVTIGEVAQWCARALHASKIIPGPGGLAAESERVLQEAKPPEVGPSTEAKLAQALRLTQEYCGSDMLPPIPGWSWWEALTAYHGGPFIPADMHSAFDTAGIDANADPDAVGVWLREEVRRRRHDALMSSVRPEATAEVKPPDLGQDTVFAHGRLPAADRFYREPEATSPERRPVGSSRYSWVFSSQLRETLEHNQSLVGVLASALEDLDEALAARDAAASQLDDMDAALDIISPYGMVGDLVRDARLVARCSTTLEANDALVHIPDRLTFEALQRLQLLRQ